MGIVVTYKDKEIQRFIEPLSFASAKITSLASQMMVAIKLTGILPLYTK